MIPTGSMAPTLFGEHKDFLCPKCGSPCQVGASEESRTGNKIDFPTCPNCGYTINFMQELSHGRYYPTYNGDRIVVGKYPYRLAPPERWDVAVFLCPGNAGMNYIKRVTGLPGETLRIWNGDIFISKHNPESRDPSVKNFQIARKPPERILATMLPVYDNNFQSEELRKYGWPARWSSEHPPFFFETQAAEKASEEAESAPKWEESPDGRSFTYTPRKGDTAYAQLEYRHYLPRWVDWNQIKPVPMDAATRQAIRPRLITDMTGYNTGRSVKPGSMKHPPENYYTPPPETWMYGYHWVGDLIAECTVDVLRTDSGARFSVGLTKGGHPFWCEINLETGEAELSIPSVPDRGDVPLPNLPGKVVRSLRPQWMAEVAEEEYAQQEVRDFLKMSREMERSAIMSRGWSAAQSSDQVASPHPLPSDPEIALRSIPGTFGEKMESAEISSHVGSRVGNFMNLPGETVRPTNEFSRKPPRETEKEVSPGVTFPPEPKIIGHRERIIAKEVPVRDSLTGEPDTLVFHEKMDVPIYDSPSAGETAYMVRKPGENEKTPAGTNPTNPHEGEFYTPRGQTPMLGVNTYHVRFANVDNQLHLWINNRLIRFDLPTAYCDLGIWQPVAEDLRPVTIKSCCAGVRVSDLRIFRDIYYIAAADTRSELSDFRSPGEMFYEAGLIHPGEQWKFYTDPKFWGMFRTHRRPIEFKLENGQYFMMGDNSAASSDCRIWDAEHYVDEKLLIGEAYFVFWPHPWKGFIPNFSKMRRIR